jgi:2-keto-3-deoxy-L-rhamnonate aldolase RhmA
MSVQEAAVTDFQQSVRNALMQTASTTAAKVLVEEREGLDRGDADVAVEDMAARMVFAAPPEIRASFSTVVSWHRWNDIVNQAMAQGNMDRASEAQQQLDALVRGVH